MTHRWCASVAMLAPDNYRAQAAVTAAQMSGNAADAVPEFFSRPVGPAGASRPWFWLAHSRILESVLDVLPAMEALYPGARWTVTQHDDDTPEQAAGRQDVATWLASQGLVFLDEQES